ncbi:Cytoplasmic tRNA 2-thiolation protein 2-A [Holothuria leucospilota]|uniref:Cytoplasmic tRNA 2-thiolation protein 2 n=1 Tax=Holothuria leucospilota TaxID=206669 RepID=A0A9Q1CBL1_HOLLE|nr:Cytoplasmic tRNA 2-thiolation protein 2-A [Holothuria leucospilota]
MKLTGIVLDASHTKMGKSCVKCSEAATVVARLGDPFCRACFLEYFTHKFRATFGKSKAVRNGEKVLIAFSGGQSSCAMLHLVKEGLQNGVHKKLRYIPGVVFIDESICMEQPQNDKNAQLESIRGWLEDSSFPAYISSLEEAMKASDSEVRILSVSSPEEVEVDFKNLKIDPSLNEKFIKLWHSTSTLTAKEDLLHILRVQLLKRISKQLGYTKIMSGESGTRLATRILTDLSKGRGSSVSQDMSFVDGRDKDVSILRPMREFNSKEIAMYNHQCGLQHVFVPNISTKAGQFTSINALTEEFVNGLQTNFPSTVSTILKTGEKLTSQQDAANTSSVCLICQSLLDMSELPCSASSATRYSQKLQKDDTNSMHMACNEAKDTCVASKPETSSCCGQGDGSCQSLKKNPELVSDDVSVYLCYGCRLMIKDVTDCSTLPPSVIDEVQRQKRREGMREEIQDFLLNDDDDGDDR